MQNISLSLPHMKAYGFAQPNTLSLLNKNKRSQGLSSRYIYGNNAESHGGKSRRGGYRLIYKIAEDQTLKK